MKGRRRAKRVILDRAEVIAALEQTTAEISHLLERSPDGFIKKWVELPLGRVHAADA